MEDVARFEAYLEARTAKRRLLHTLAELAESPLYESRMVYQWRVVYQWRGLVRVIFGRQWRAGGRPPRGYGVVPLWDRDALAVMPLWLYPFYRPQREWQRLVFEPLVAVGAWVVAEGDYYLNGCPAWHQPFGAK